MTSPIKRGEPGSQVSEWFPLSNQVTVTQAPRIPIVNPYGLPVRHTLFATVISSVSTSGGVATFTAQNKFVAGDSVVISNVTPTGYNGTFTVNSATSTTFSVTTATLGLITVSGNAVLNTAPVIPSSVTWMWAVCVAGGGYNITFSGGVAWGWTLKDTNYKIGNGGTSLINTASAAYTKYGHIIAGGLQLLGSSGSGSTAGATNYYGQPGGILASATATFVYNGAGGAGGVSLNTTSLTGLKGGDGISGGNGQSLSVATGTVIAGNGGNGFVGGGGGACSTSSGSRTGGNGGTGIGIDGTAYTGGLGSTGTGTNGAGGGGAGMLGNGFAASGLLGGIGGLGGGCGGANAIGSSTVTAMGGGGLIYLCY